MDLYNVPISDENKQEIQDGFLKSYELDKHAFMQLYIIDKLGESIPNVTNWLNQVYGGLNTFQ
jgi:hypothetical protein